MIEECNEGFGLSVNDETDYTVGWNILTGNRSVDNIREEYLYHSSSALDGYPYWGQLSVYGGGGYLARLTGNERQLLSKFKQLQSEQWVDRYTRAIFVEFTVYNPQINLFAITTMLLEFSPSGGIFPSYRFEPAMLLPYMTSVMLFQIACEIIYLIFTLFFVFKEMRSIWKQRCSYFKQFWNLIQLGICIMSVSAIVIYFYRLIVTNQQTARFRETQGYAYQKFQYVGYWSEMFTYMIGWLVFFSSLKFLKLLRFNKKMSLLASTLKNSVKDLMYFSVIFTIVFLAFIQLFYLIYISSIPTFQTFISSIESGILMMMGKFDIYSMLMAEPILTQISIFFFVITITFIIVNMFLSILNETFGSVRSDISKQSNDYEIVDFIIGRFRLWTGLGTQEVKVKPGDPVKSTPQAGRSEALYSIENQIDNFPERMDKFLKSLSNMYIDKSKIDFMFERAAEHRASSSEPHPLPNYGNLLGPSPRKSPVKFGLTDVHTH